VSGRGGGRLEYRSVGPGECRRDGQIKDVYRLPSPLSPLTVLFCCQFINIMDKSNRIDDAVVIFVTRRFGFAAKEFMKYEPIAWRI